MCELTLHSATEAAKILHVTPRTLYTIVAQREIEHVRIGGAIKLTPQAIEDYVNRRTIPRLERISR